MKLTLSDQLCPCRAAQAGGQAGSAMIRGICFVCVAAVVAVGAHIWTTPKLSHSGAVPDAHSTQIESVVASVFRREFGVSASHPAIVRNDRTCSSGKNTDLVTTAYIRTTASRATLLYMRLSTQNFSVINKERRSHVVPPAGRFRVLVITLRHDKTNDSKSLALLEDAQKQINLDHAAFANIRRYSAPIVSFENTNIVIEPRAIAAPRDPTAVRTALKSTDAAKGQFDFVVVINIDPEQVEGGFAGSDGSFVYMGNYGDWRRPLSGSEWLNVARAVYHHEIAHHWGWRHGWLAGCPGQEPRYAPFVVDPALFGWEDPDGNGVPQILGHTAYACSH